MVRLWSKREGRFSRDTDHGLIYSLILVVYIISFFLVERAIPVEICTATDLPIDRWIPLWEGFIVPYLLWLPMLVAMGVLLLWKDRRAYPRYMVLMGVAFMSTLILYLMFPNCQNLRPAQLLRKNIFTWMLSQVYAADNNANVCPSLHAIGSFVVAAAAWDSPALRRPRFLIPTWICAFLVAISIVFVKQHGILDLIFAVPHTAISYFVVYKLIYGR